MKKKTLLLALAALMTVSALSGCVSVEERPLQSEPVTDVVTTTTTPAPQTTTTTEKIVLTTTAETTTTTTGTSNVVTDPEHPEVEEQYGSFPISDENKEFLSRCCFVGDSICSGLYLYDILSSKNVVAQGSTAARNIFDFTFTWNGEEMELIPAIVNRQPEYVIFWMGMNDVNITDPETYAKDYESLMNEVEAYCPDAQLVVLSISPVLYTSQFTANENIDRFNASVKEMIEGKEDKSWLYVDVTPELKNSLNSMKTLYNGGDGIHLAPEAYYAVLSEVCNGIDFKTIDKEHAERATTATTTTTAKTEKPVESTTTTAATR